MAAALACIPLIGGIIFYIVEKHDSFVRFYAMQSIIFGGAWLLFSIVSTICSCILWSIPAIGGILVFFWGIIQALVHIAFLVVWIVATVKAFTGVRWDIPYIGPVARRQMEGGASSMSDGPTGRIRVANWAAVDLNVTAAKPSFLVSQ